jgi:regulator of replication initiation timing
MGKIMDLLEIALKRRYDKQYKKHEVMLMNRYSDLVEENRMLRVDNEKLADEVRKFWRTNA